MGARILIVEDDADINEIIAVHLARRRAARHQVPFVKFFQLCYHFWLIRPGTHDTPPAPRHLQLPLVPGAVGKA